MPGTSSAWPFWPGSSTSFTGMRWTTFTKLPEAFSGGSSEKREPVPLWIESTRALRSRPGCVSTEIARALAGPHVGELRLLVVRDHPHVDDVDDGEQRLARLHGLAHLDRAPGDAAGDRRGDRRVLEVQLGLAQRRARLGHLRLGAGRLRAADRHLAPPAAGIAQRGLGLLALPAGLGERHLLAGQLGLGLGHLGARGVEALARRLERRPRRLERALRVVELLTRDQRALEQLLRAARDRGRPARSPPGAR